MSQKIAFRESLKRLETKYNDALQRVDVCERIVDANTLRFSQHVDEANESWKDLKLAMEELRDVAQKMHTQKTLPARRAYWLLAALLVLDILTWAL